MTDRPDEFPSGSGRAAVLGSPIAHSLSPALHRAAYRHLGLGWTFDAYEVGESQLPAFLAGLDASWKGLALTMPLKRAVLSRLDVVSAVAAEIGAANTVTVQAAGSPEREAGAPRGRTARPGERGGLAVSLHGHNTDAPGLVAALAEAGITAAETAAIIGGGATATSAVWALAKVGVTRTTVIARDRARCSELLQAAARMGVQVRILAWDELLSAADADVVIATTPHGSTRRLVESLDARARRPSAGAALFDVVYDPWPSPLAQAWAAAGGTVLSGFDLLVHQAALQIRLMTRREVPLAVLRSAGEHALAARTAAASRAAAGLGGLGAHPADAAPADQGAAEPTARGR